MFQHAVEQHPSEQPRAAACSGPRALHALVAERRHGRAQLVFQRLSRADKLRVLCELPRKDALCLLRRLPNQTIVELLQALPADWSRDFWCLLPARKRVAVRALQSWSDAQDM